MTPMYVCLEVILRGGFEASQSYTDLATCHILHSIGTPDMSDFFAFFPIEERVEHDPLYQIDVPESPSIFSFFHIYFHESLSKECLVDIPLDVISLQHFVLFV